MKEREYQRKVFGDYQDNPALSVASFLIFLKSYIDKALEAYGANWQSELPPWLITCKELKEQSHAPAKVYEELIKIMALAGAAIEGYSQIDIKEWRHDGIKQKWVKEELLCPTKT